MHLYTYDIITGRLQWEKRRKSTYNITTCHSISFLFLSPFQICQYKSLVLFELILWFYFEKKSSSVLRRRRRCRWRLNQNGKERGKNLVIIKHSADSSTSNKNKRRESERKSKLQVPISSWLAFSLHRARIIESSRATLLLYPLFGTNRAWVWSNLFELNRRLSHRREREAIETLCLVWHSDIERARACAKGKGRLRFHSPMFMTAVNTIRHLQALHREMFNTYTQWTRIWFLYWFTSSQVAAKIARVNARVVQKQGESAQDGTVYFKTAPDKREMPWVTSNDNKGYHRCECSITNGKSCWREEKGKGWKKRARKKKRKSLWSETISTGVSTVSYFDQCWPLAILMPCQRKALTDPLSLSSCCDPIRWRMTPEEDFTRRVKCRVIGIGISRRSAGLLVLLTHIIS